MGLMTVGGTRHDDPRKLRDMLGRATQLASGHALGSVVVGIAGPEGDVVFPEILDFLESALRVDDSIFRMTRERAVVCLADVDRARAEEIVERVLSDFRSRFAVAVDPAIRLGYFEVTPTTSELSVKQVLLALFM